MMIVVSFFPGLLMFKYSALKAHIIGMQTIAPSPQFKSVLSTEMSSLFFYIPSSLAPRSSLAFCKYIMYSVSPFTGKSNNPCGGRCQLKAGVDLLTECLDYMFHSHTFQ